MVWKMKEWPRDWVQGNLCFSSKKGKKECSNNWTIHLIIHASKAIRKIIIKRIKQKYGEEISEE